MHKSNLIAVMLTLLILFGVLQGFAFRCKIGNPSEVSINGPAMLDRQ